MHLNQTDSYSHLSAAHLSGNKQQDGFRIGSSLKCKIYLFLNDHICAHFLGFSLISVSQSQRRSSKKHYLHHRCSAGLSTHWQPHKACLETDDKATKTTQVAADHLEEKCLGSLRSHGVTAERSKTGLKERDNEESEG